MRAKFQIPGLVVWYGSGVVVGMGYPFDGCTSGIWNGHNCSNMESKEVSFLIFVRQLWFANTLLNLGVQITPQKRNTHTHTAHHTKKDRSLICFAAPGDIQDLKSPGTKEPHRLRDLRDSTINIWVLPSYLLALPHRMHEEIKFPHTYCSTVIDAATTAASMRTPLREKLLLCPLASDLTLGAKKNSRHMIPNSWSRTWSWWPSNDKSHFLVGNLL